MVTRIGQRSPSRTYVQEWVEARGLTQDQLAGRMDCSPGTVSKLLSGRMKLTVEWLSAIADALGPDVDVRDLFRHPDAPTQEDLLRGMSDGERDRIVRAIKALTGTDG